MSDHVLVSRHDAVLHLRLNRPEKMNALTLEMYSVLADAMAEAADDESVHAIVFSGAGDHFTGGNDLRDFLDRPPAGEESPVLRFLHALDAAPKPLVAAVQGMAVGIGTTMLLHCDLVYGTEDAQLMMPFVQLGLVPEAGSSLLLPRRIGYPRAAEMLLLGEPMAGADAHAAGLLSDLVTDGPVEEHALAQAAKLAAMPERAVELSRELLRGTEREGVTERMEEEARLFVERLQSEEAQAAMTAFFNRQ